MSINKKLLATAVVGALYTMSSAAFAAVNISDKDSDPLQYASEIVKSTSATNPGVTLANTAGNDLQFRLDYNFSDNEVRYARVECTNLKFLPTPVVTNDAEGNLAVGSVNGTNTNAIYFSITDLDGVDEPTEDTMFNIDASYRLLNNNDVVCTYRLYDQPSQAQAGGDVGLIRSASGTFIQSVSGVNFDTDPHVMIADVEAANGAYTDFSGDGNLHLGDVTFEAVDGVLNTAGSQITLADIFGANTTFVANGDFSAFEDVGFCEGAAFTVNANASTASYKNGANERYDEPFCVLPDGETAIPASKYTITLNPQLNTGYAFNGVTKPLGEIVRNGTELQAPLAQVPGGWLSRMVLTNTGSVERPYAIQILSEEGNLVGATNLTGTVPAMGTRVVDLDTVLKSFTVAPRATLIVTVAAPNDQIQGLYQIVNPDKGSISNHVMVRPGTN